MHKTRLISLDQPNFYLQRCSLHKLSIQVSVLSPDMEVHILVDEPQHVVEAALLNLTAILSDLSNIQVNILSDPSYIKWYGPRYMYTNYTCANIRGKSTYTLRRL